MQLVEAGPDYALAKEGPAGSPRFAGARGPWPRLGLHRGAGPKSHHSLSPGEVIGGTSPINAAEALWGAPEDFAEWRHWGAAIDPGEASAKGVEAVLSKPYHRRSSCKHCSDLTWLLKDGSASS